MRVIRVGERYSIVTGEVETYDLLPVKTYLVICQGGEFFLKEHPNISVREKIYGSHENKVNKVLQSFENFERSLGIILSGDKGIGKSIFAKMLCQKAIEKEYPVIIVDEAYDGIARFIESIEQQCVVLFDEFDKTFRTNMESDQQAHLLSLFDGTSGGKKMYIVTCNELYGLNDYIVNRPGRFHYHFRFGYPTATEIQEYLEDKLEKEYYGEIKKVIEFAARIKLNYDCLRAIAFELNQGSTFADAITELNILNVGNEEYDVYLYFESGEVLQNYNYVANLYDERGRNWISFYSPKDSTSVNVEYDKGHLSYDPIKKEVIAPAEHMIISYDDDEEGEGIEVKGAKVTHMAFVKSKEKNIHYSL